MAKRQAATAQAEPDLLGGAPVQTVTKPAKAKPEVAKPAVSKGQVAKIEPAKQEPASQNMLVVIARAAADPKLDAEKMRALLDMQKEVVAEEARLAFVRAFRKLREELPVINRDGKIEVRKKDSAGDRTGAVQQSTFYATYENLMQVCEPIFLRHGFSFWSAVEPSPDGTRINVVSYIDHDDGHQRESRFPLPAEVSGSKNNVQGWGSSQSYGKRYNAIALLNIQSRAPADRDTDGNEPVVADRRKGNRQTREVIEGDGVVLLSKAQVEELKLAIQDCGVELERFLKSYGIESIEQLPANQLAEAKKSCAQYKARVAQARGE